MVIEQDILPLFTWLLGPRWYEGTFFNWLPLSVAVLVLMLAVAWLVIALRKGSERAAKIAGRTSAIGLVLSMSVVLTLWFADPQRMGLFGSSLITDLIRSLEGPLGTAWYLGALYYWLFLVASLALAALVIGWLVAAVRGGPVRAFRSVDRALAAGAVDLAMTSPRRVFALSWLAVKESIRRRVVVVFAVFILVLLFAGWFLDPGSPHPARLYLSFVLTATGYLVFLLALFLSALSLPADIKSKTLHTVVTKPVRPSEIVLGRVLGFTAIGTLLLTVMGVVSYFFVTRGLAHTHKLSQADLHAVAGQASVMTGRTETQHDHFHEVIVGPKGATEVKPQRGHTHELTIQKQDGKSTYQLGPPRGRLVARVPIRGTLRFKDSTGREVDKGINVGDEWTYRSYIQGDSAAAAIWTFDGITEANFPADQPKFAKSLPLEMTLEVFRTTKGKTDDPKDIPGTLGSLSVRTTTGKIIQLEAALKQLRQERDRFELPMQQPKQPGAKLDPEQEEIQKVRRHYQRDIGELAKHLNELRSALPDPIQVDLFEARDFVTDVHHIPRKVKTADGRQLDLFKDLAPEGKLEVWLQCEEPAQYFGAAQADVYFRAGDAYFWLNLAKGYLGIWMQMVLVIGIGVTYSTFLSGPIAMLATLGTLVGAVFRQFLGKLAAGAVIGGGPLEAFDRLLTQRNVVSELDPGVRSRVVQMVDEVLEYGLAVVSAALPEFGRFSYADYVAYGFNVPGNLLMQCLLQALAFLVPVFLAGYFFLKTREVAR